jgi:hypothetical protein
MRHEPLNCRHSRGIDLEEAIFAACQQQLAHFNRRRFTPGLGGPPSEADKSEILRLAAVEEAFIEGARDSIAPLADDVPSDPDGFVAWFESLRETGPGQGDILFPWLATTASRAQMQWFLSQEVAGEAGFEDLLAVTQVKMPTLAKLEMARNFWDEMGHGRLKGMHGPMLDKLAKFFELNPTRVGTVAESLALGNLMIGLAANRHYGFHSVGALGAIELTAPTRAGFVAEGLKRLGVPAKESHYFILHAVLDVKHSESWNREVLHTLVAEDRRRARAIAEGALLRLWCGRRCFDRYRREFGI